MDSKLQQLSERIEQVLGDLHRLQTENADLKSQKDQLQSELVSAEKEYRSLKLEAADQSETAKVKLTSILARLEQLEKLSE